MPCTGPIRDGIRVTDHTI
uniref:Uncharacterized protein n=1 Tax=Arundo donax TaxID=35708 RepID=A0A0A8ZNH8_ARUDO